MKRGTKDRARLRPERQCEGTRARALCSTPASAPGQHAHPRLPSTHLSRGKDGHLNLNPLNLFAKFSSYDLQ